MSSFTFVLIYLLVHVFFRLFFSHFCCFIMVVVIFCLLSELPGKIRNITFTSQAPDRIVLFWRPPINWPRANISYKVACEVNCLQGNCSPGCPKLQFTPSRNNLLQTNVTVRGFGHEGNRYIFKIYSKNRWYDFSEYGQVEWNFNAINFTGKIISTHCFI